MERSKMTFKVHYDNRSKCVIGTYRGTLDMKSLEGYAYEIMKVASNHDCTSFLNDLRKAEVNLSTFDLYYIPETLHKMGFKRWWKRAIVASEQLDDYYFFELTAQNRGCYVKIFEDMVEAMKWVKYP
jgi:hypothetical protein